ncbi:uncharacterized protein RCH25_043493 [Pelodytes ibericus]
MNVTRAESSAKRKRTKPHKLGDKKRLFSRRDSDEIVVSTPQTQKSKAEEFQKAQEYSSACPTEESVPQKCSNGGNSSTRGRGRPKGSKNKSFTASSVMVSTVSRAKNEQYQRALHHPPAFSKQEHEEKREHPNGGDITPRGRGRPKGSKNRIFPGSMKVTIQPTEENTPKRMRGRPKGSLNKTPSKAALMLKSGTPKLGRGRPKKLVTSNGAVIPKRGRGRPKGSLNKSPSLRKIAVSAGSTGLKKRGRPKKTAFHDIPLTPKNPRGRPKSIVKSEAVYADEFKDSTSDKDDEDTGSDNDNTP